MESNGMETKQTGRMDRFWKLWVPLLALIGVLTALTVAALQVRPRAKVAPLAKVESGTAGASSQSIPSVPPVRVFTREYSKTAVVGGTTSSQPFRRSLVGIAVGAGDRIHALGDDQVRIFDPNGSAVREWSVPGGRACIATGPDGHVYVGSLGRVDIYDDKGSLVGGFVSGNEGKPANVTAIKVFQKEILVADGAALFIRRYDMSGRQIGEIGTRNKTGGFILPNGWLDFDVDSEGIVRAGDAGRHRVTSWTLKGAFVGYFGKFGMTDPVDFVGCCNPVNIAVAPDGAIVTAEKMVARVKVYDRSGNLLAVIGPGPFDSDCTHIYLAVDSKGRILAADPVRREITVFSPVIKSS